VLPRSRRLISGACCGVGYAGGRGAAESGGPAARDFQQRQLLEPTDAKGVIRIFTVGAERMLGYTAAEVMNKLFLCTALIKNATESFRSTREDQ
jgi:hypothetical protein